MPVQYSPSAFVAIDSSSGELDKFEDRFTTRYVAFDHAADDHAIHAPLIDGRQVAAAQLLGDLHIAQLLPWIEANFRTFAEYDGRAVSGFSMRGFGALEYAAKYYGHFASVSAHSGPASLRRDFGLVVHWANITSAVLDLGGGTVYGAPNWDQARVSADNPVERIESYRNRRIFLVAGTSPDPLNWFDSVNETQVLAGQREFRERLSEAGIPRESHEVPGGHVFRPDMFVLDLDGIIARLRHASSAASGGAAHPTRTWHPTNCIESTNSVCRRHARDAMPPPGIRD